MVKKAVLMTSSVSNRLRTQKEIRRILEERGILIQEEIKFAGSLLLLKAGHPNAAELNDTENRARQLAAHL
jgi:hypothetical protein